MNRRSLDLQDFSLRKRRLSALVGGPVLAGFRDVEHIFGGFVGAETVQLHHESIFKGDFPKGFVQAVAGRSPWACLGAVFFA
jgi:hypothetical protein